MRHIGGSLLPSNEPRILTPIETSFGTLQVRVIAELDTHGLFLKRGDGETLLATHPNGYSCHELAKRMVSGAHDQIAAQIQYILDCGGTSRNPTHILNAVDRS